MKFTCALLHIQTQVTAMNSFVFFSSIFNEVAKYVCTIYKTSRSALSAYKDTTRSEVF